MTRERRGAAQASPVEPPSPVPAPGVAVEVATWPPLEVEQVDGWRLGFSGGLTRRANSALPLAEPADVLATVVEVERRYRAVGLPTVVRVGRESRPAGLAAVLEERGYRRVALTDVLVRDAADPARGQEPHGPGPDGTRIDVSAAPADDWLACWLGVKAGGGADHGLARAILEGAPAVYLTVRDRAGVSGVIRAAFAADWVGLSCLVVEPQARRRGLGRALTAAALDAARAHGAARAFLQVEVHNTGAAALYAGLGFQAADRYGYLERADQR
ncbi:GNAT family N-acetyltransferase [Cellulomonas chengniuliangii]|uniref:GNAT family N-acetyltransferase n=1 Tax=Cellulomonas chengniuliangii TaxID=2968084 RepID=A0ABY5L340_9CELL|nr:GNAT family N-acetyltransferase [Cellulomonas chengniuliangii]MCC2309849.1 GNAT family N-acetyltransferase [Cellulomonas chengniuliangii]UUI76293.1 GNAT family N-acetyltransferase [Cellulomonas chengniuliangii]